jgi:hypothetical protein
VNLCLCPAHLGARPHVEPVANVLHVSSGYLVPNQPFKLPTRTAKDDRMLCAYLVSGKIRTRRSMFKTAFERVARIVMEPLW